MLDTLPDAVLIRMLTYLPSFADACRTLQTDRRALWWHHEEAPLWRALARVHLPQHARWKVMRDERNDDDETPRRDDEISWKRLCQMFGTCGIAPSAVLRTCPLVIHLRGEEVVATRTTTPSRYHRHRDDDDDGRRIVFTTTLTHVGGTSSVAGGPLALRLGYRACRMEEGAFLTYRADGEETCEWRQIVQSPWAHIDVPDDAEDPPTRTAPEELVTTLSPGDVKTFRHDVRLHHEDHASRHDDKEDAPMTASTRRVYRLHVGSEIYEMRVVDSDEHPEDDATACWQVRLGPLEIPRLVRDPNDKGGDHSASLIDVPPDAMRICSNRVRILPSRRQHGKPIKAKSD